MYTYCIAYFQLFTIVEIIKWLLQDTRIPKTIHN